MNVGDTVKLLDTSIVRGQISDTGEIIDDTSRHGLDFVIEVETPDGRVRKVDVKESEISLVS